MGLIGSATFLMSALPCLQNEKAFQKQPTIFVGKKRGISKAISKDAKEGAAAPKLLRYWKQAR
jgi:hypothetical protein